MNCIIVSCLILPNHFTTTLSKISQNQLHVENIATVREFKYDMISIEVDSNNYFYSISVIE